MKLYSTDQLAKTFLKIKKKIWYFLISTVFVKVTSYNWAFGEVGTPDCGMYEIREGCEFGGWVHLIPGDVIIGALLAIFLYFLAHRSNVKLENNSKIIQKIVEMQEEQRNRRKDYAVFNLKSLFTHTLHILGQVNKSILNFNSIQDSNIEQNEKEWRQTILQKEIKDEENRLARVIETIRNNLLSANDVLEPDVTNQIEGICMYLNEIKIHESEHGRMDLPKYHISKKKIKYVIETLNTYAIDSHSFVKKENEIIETSEDKK